MNSALLKLELLICELIVSAFIAFSNFNTNRMTSSTFYSKVDCVF